MKPENLKHLIADISEAIVEHRMGAHMVWEDREDGSEGFTEEAQDLFCEISDIVEAGILKHIK